MENHRMTCGYGELEDSINEQEITLRCILGSLLEKIEGLEKRNDELELIVKFHKLEIPLKYRRSGLLDGDRSLFKTRENFKSAAFPVVGNLSEGVFERSELSMPKDPEEYTKAKERMMDRNLMKRSDKNLYYDSKYREKYLEAMQEISEA
jgi:hypothetical protein